MTEGLAKLKNGEFNNMNQKWLPDGSVFITLMGHSWPEPLQFRVRDLYKENEELLDIETGEPL